MTYGLTVPIFHLLAMVTLLTYIYDMLSRILAFF